MIPIDFVNFGHFPTCNMVLVVVFDFINQRTSPFRSHFSGLVMNMAGC
ncbi:hypothetical protein AHF37_12143 [Paragonimus kellicotti]|nr:hypothetical protein AHF37_12143 [Paragonimus kellicotti]